MENAKKYLIAAAVLLAVSFLLNLGLIYAYAKIARSSSENEQIRQYNARLMLFRNLFTKNILLSDQVVSFEERVKMEEAVRALGDDEIYGLWQSFSKSANSEEVSLRAKKLLDALISKTRY